MNGKADNRIKGKIAPALLSALALALTVFVFGPFELYANNMSEFLVSSLNCLKKIKILTKIELSFADWFFIINFVLLCV